MNNGLKSLLTFSLGVAAGSIVTWKLLDEKYKRLFMEEMEREKEEYKKMHRREERVERMVTAIMEEMDEDEDVDAHPILEKPDIFEYASKVSDLGYTHYASMHDKSNRVNIPKEVVDVERPYVIKPEEFDELDDYEAISLTYYEGDGVVTDDLDCPVENVDDVVGLDSLRHFGEYEEDSVFVRNDVLKTDYEILLDVRKYSDVVSINPHSAEDE